MNKPYHILVKIFHPKDFYNWKTDEEAIGIAQYRLKDDYFWVKIGKDEKFVYRLNTENIKEFIKKHPRSTDFVKGTLLYIIPIGKWGRSLKLYSRFSIRRYEELKEEEKLKRFSMAVL